MKHPRPVLASPGHTQSRYSSFLYPKQPKFSDRPKSPNPNPTPALTLTLESAILAKWLTLTSRSGMLSFVVVPFTNGSPMGMGKMTTFFHPYTSPLSIFFFWIDISPFLKTLSCSCSTGIERGAVQMRCTAPVRRALSNHIIFIAPGFILFSKVGLIRSTGFCWINIKIS